MESGRADMADMTLTDRAFTSAPTAHLARWRGGPSVARAIYLQSAFHYDAGDPWRGFLAMKCASLLREALSKASREVIEKIAWEVVPELAETIIREELERLLKERGSV